MNFSITSPLEKSLISRKHAIENDDYEGFVSQLHIDLNAKIQDLQQYSSMYHNLGEDVITVFLVTNLKSMAYNAYHDVYNNGHVDLFIEAGNFKWLGECKLQGGPSYSNKGFKQLTTRYSDGHEYSRSGGILIYNQKKSKTTLDCMEEWHGFLESEPEIQALNLYCDPLDIQSGRPYFDSTHKHEKSGMNYKIRHFFVNLFHNPKDKNKK